MTLTATNQSVWTATSELPRFPHLTASLNADVCVVGAGIAGLTTAYLLARSGQKVVVLDDGEIVSGMTEVTTAHLSNVLDDRFTRMEQWHGDERTRLAAESHAAAIDLIERVAIELGVDRDFRRVPGYLFLSPDTPRELLDDELAAAQRAGLRDAELLTSAPIAPLGSVPAIRFPNQARFHPLKYLAAVAEAITRLGGKIFTHSHVTGVDGGKTTSTWVGTHSISSAATVVATNAPINNLVAIHTKQAPYTTYVVGARVPTDSVEDALYWDTEDLYHYVRLQPSEGGDLVIIGGEDHKSGQAHDTELRHDRLFDWARERFPTIEEIEFTWAGQYMETIDGLAFIGRNPMDTGNVYVITGDSGMGMTHGAIAGMLISDLILGNQNPWEELYDPSRKTIPAAGRFLKENINVATRYVDWLTPGEVKSIEEIRRGSGAVLRSGLTKIAVYRDKDGSVRKMTAVCPHLKCIVAWNDAEKTWDCPCHGSRFAAHGEVINGPANIGLARIDAE